MSKYLLSFPFRFQFDAYVFLVSITIRSSIFAQAVHAQEYLATRRGAIDIRSTTPTLQVDSHGNNKICRNFDDLNSLIFRLMSFLWVQIQYLLVEFVYINYLYELYLSPYICSMNLVQWLSSLTGGLLCIDRSMQKRTVSKTRSPSKRRKGQSQMFIR